jgi:hypothetical protein
MDDEVLSTTLRRLPPSARVDLRRLLIRDQPDRDAIAEQLLRRRTSGANDLAELIDILSLDPEGRRQMVRVLGELEAVEGGATA